MYARVDDHMPWIDKAMCTLTDTYSKRCAELYRPTPVDYAQGEVASDAYCVKAVQCVDGLLYLSMATTKMQVKSWVEANCCQEGRLPSKGYTRHVWSILSPPPCAKEGELCDNNPCCSGLACVERKSKKGKRGKKGKMSNRGNAAKNSKKCYKVRSV
jgi:hypothetical protein